MSIPVMGVVVLDSSMRISGLLETIDYRIEDLFIVNNSDSDEELDRLVFMGHPMVTRMRVSHTPGHIGVAASWNLVIKSFMNSPLWLFASDRVRFDPGFLKLMHETAVSDPVLGIVHGSPGEFGVGSWDVFLIRDDIIQIMGLFDENSSPLGCEGADYFFRTVHRPLKKIFDVGAGYRLEGSAGEAPFLEVDYLKEKWGDWRAERVLENPFGNPAIPVSASMYDLSLQRKIRNLTVCGNSSKMVGQGG